MILLSQIPTNHNMKQNSNDYMSLHTLETQFWTFARLQKKEGERFKDGRWGEGVMWAKRTPQLNVKRKLTRPKDDF